MLDLDAGIGLILVITRVEDKVGQVDDYMDVVEEVVEVSRGCNRNRLTRCPYPIENKGSIQLVQRDRSPMNRVVVIDGIELVLDEALGEVLDEVLGKVLGKVLDTSLDMVLDH